jgi:hypothetical protein
MCPRLPWRRRDFITTGQTGRGRKAGGRGFGEDLYMRNPAPHPARGLDSGTQLVLPEALQVPRRPAPIDLVDHAPARVRLPIQHVQENDFAAKRPGEAIGQREDFQWTFRQVDWEQQPVGLQAEVVTRQF